MFALLCLSLSTVTPVPPDDAAMDRAVAQFLEPLGEEHVWHQLMKRAIPNTAGVKAYEKLMKLGKPAIPSLAKVLAEDESWVRRANMALIIGHLRDETGYPPLRHAAVNDSHPMVRQLAAQGCWHDRSLKTLETFLTLTGDEEAQVRQTALSGLRLFLETPDGFELNGDNRRRVERAVVDALNDPDADVRYTSIDAAKVVQSVDAVPALIRCLDDERYIPNQAADALGEIGDRRAVVPLIDALEQDDDPEYLTMFAARALGKIGDVRAVTPLIGLLDDSESYVRHDAAEALGKLGDRRAVGPLIKALGDDEPSVVNAAVLALGELGDPRAVEPILAVLSKRAKSDKGRWLTPLATALGRLNDPRAIGPLTEALFNGTPRNHADAEALARGVIAIRHPDAMAGIVENLLAEKGDRSARVIGYRLVGEAAGRGVDNPASLKEWWDANKKWYRGK